MALRFRCSACSQLYRVPDATGGRTIHCFSCGQAVIASTKNWVDDDAPVDHAAGEMVIGGVSPGKTQVKTQPPVAPATASLELVKESNDAPLRLAADDDDLPQLKDEVTPTTAKKDGIPAQEPQTPAAKPRILVPVSRTPSKGQTTRAPGAGAKASASHQGATSRPKLQRTRSDNLPSLDTLEELSGGQAIVNPVDVPLSIQARSGPNPFLAWLHGVEFWPFFRDYLVRNGWVWFGLVILATWVWMWAERENVSPIALWLAWISGCWFILCFLIVSVKATDMNQRSRLFLPIPVMIALFVLSKFFPVIQAIRVAIVLIVAPLFILNCLWKLLFTPKGAILRHWAWLGASIYCFSLCVGSIGILLAGGESVWPVVATKSTINGHSTPVPVFSTSPPSFSQRESGVLASAVSVAGSDSRQCIRLWLYLPAGQRGQPQSVGCVFMAPAGSTCFTGMNLSPDDEPEFLPYVRAGFAVVAYDLEGALRNTESPANHEVVAAIKAFMAADGGLADARSAIEYALKWIPEIDPSRLYAAGHSSAGTVALTLAASDSRIKGCLAYAPCSDLEARLREAPEIGRLVSDAPAFIRRHSPLNVADRFACPVFLFHASDDTNVSISQTHALRARSRNVQVAAVAAGGHFDAYIEQGIPVGIGWLQSRDTLLKGARPDHSPMANRGPQPGTAEQPIPSNPDRTNMPANRPVRIPSPPTPSPRPAMTERPVPGMTNPQSSPVAPKSPGALEASTPVTERPLSAVIKPSPSPSPAVIPQPARPPALPDTPPSGPVGQLAKLGVDITTNPDGDLTPVDLRAAKDVAVAATILAGFKHVPVLRLLPSQLTPDAMLALKTIPSITRLEFSDVKISDADLARVAGLSNVDELNLAGQPITSAGIRALASMSNLKKLYLNETKIDDGAFRYLARMGSLRFLDLTDTHVTSGGIEQLVPLKNLLGLVLTHADVSDAAQEKLKVANPRLNIIPP